MFSKLKECCNDHFPENGTLLFYSEENIKKYKSKAREKVEGKTYSMLALNLFRMILEILYDMFPDQFEDAVRNEESMEFLVFKIWHCCYWNGASNPEKFRIRKAVNQLAAGGKLLECDLPLNPV